MAHATEEGTNGPKQATPLRYEIPAGACDSHVHFYGPLSRYPAQPHAAYEVPDATPEAFLALQESLGLSRAVVVHAVASGRDNRRTLDALQEYPDRFRGVVAPPLELPSRVVLAEWNRLGVRAVRFSYTGSAGRDMALDEDLVGLIAELGWHAQVHVEGEQILGLADHLSALPCRVVIDHMARIPARWGSSSQAFQCLLRLLDCGKVWVKLSAPMRLSDEAAPPYGDVADMARALVQHAPERMLWASDWPHVNFPGHVPLYSELLDLLYDWAPLPEVRNRILVDNPAELYGFDQAKRSGNEATDGEGHGID